MNIQKVVDQMKIDRIKNDREIIVKDLIENKKFNPKAAKLVVKNFISTLEYVFRTTGELPK